MSPTYRCNLQVLWSIGTAALLVACGAHASPGALPDGDASQPATSSRTFHFTRTAQKFKVPKGVTQLTITAYGAQGGGYKDASQGYPGGRGDKITATISVSAGALLFVYVGSKGISGGTNGGGGGFNGGGGAFQGAYGGGGSSDVRSASDKLEDRLIVAGGGGGSGETGVESSYENSSFESTPLFGGAGGVGGSKAGRNGGDGQDGGSGGDGGSQKSGGAGGAGRSGRSSSFSSESSCTAVDGSEGKLLTGGEGAVPSCGRGGGGGGGGYYGAGGGGGGGYSDYVATGTIEDENGGGGGGAGGSSFVEKSATDVHQKPGGGSPGDGLVIITW